MDTKTITPSIDLGKDNIFKIFMHYAIPSVITMVIIACYSLVDGIFIGRYVGPDGLAAITIAEPVYFFALALSTVISVGGNTLVGIELGKKNNQAASSRFSLSFVIIVLIGITLTFCAILFGDNIAYLLGARGDLINSVSTYIKILGFFNIFFLASDFLEDALSNLGITYIPMFCNIFAAISNIFLDYIFIVKLNMGIEGAAIASGIAFSCSFILILLTFLIKGGNKLKFIKFKFEPKIIKEIIFNGSSEAITTASSAFTAFLLNIVLLKIAGDLGVASFSILLFLDEILMAVNIGIAEAIAPIISYNYGANNKDRIIKTLQFAIITVISIGFITTIGLFLFGENLVSLFTNNDSSLIDFTVNAMNIYAVCFLVCGVNVIGSAYFTSVAHPKESALIGILGEFVFILLGMAILPVIVGVNGVWLTFVIADFSTLIVTLFLISKTKKDILGSRNISLRKLSFN
ncbi:MAG: MATE family efflux transporter [Peptostreptococcaceae bacterium]